MYLKRLELQGFKSFASRTLFEFAPGITAVVGPNGTGKSNVAESLRWVLGEQRSRNIRGSKLEDVIFSGSSQRAAVGMAEVSITFDNSEGWLPVDFSEVVVSRRAYRNGESEYLINKSKVRLRDVLDLLMRAQVGQNSYAFMGQGLVDEVLAMRPEERRRLLEEAADVRLLRSRLDEARDRLSATRENLERVQMLINEIGPRLQQLERQATRAAEHSKLAAELAVTIRELYARLWRESNEGLASARAGLDQKQQELNVSQAAAKACEEGLAAISAALEERERELNARHERQRGITDRIHSLEQRLALDAERLNSHSTRRTEIQAELQSLRNERLDLQAAVAQAMERQTGIQPEIEDASRVVQARRQELSAIEQEQAGLRRRIAEAEEKLERAQRGAREAATAISRLTEDESRLQGEGVRRQTRRRDIMERLVVVGREFKELRDRLSTLEIETATAERARSDAMSSVEHGRTTTSAQESEALKLEAALAQLHARQEMLLRLQGASEGMDAGVRYLLGSEDETKDDRRRSDAVEGLIGLVRDMVRVPAGLERAIEAALAENIQALVFENLPSALAAIDLLHERQTGRAIIYPLDLVKMQPPLNLMREKGVVGVAAKMVRVDNNRARPLVDVLLGRTIICETVPVAQQVLRRGLGSVVTLEGVLLKATGSVAGGVSLAATDTFTRQRELEELPEEIATMEGRKTDADARLERSKADLQRAEAQLAEAEPRLHNLREERNKRQTAMLDNRGKLIILRGEARALSAEMRTDDDNIDWRGRRTQLQLDQRRYETDIRAAEEALAADRATMSGFAARRNAAIDAISEAASAHAGLEGEARSLHRQLEQEQAALSRAEARLRAREETLVAIDVEGKIITDRDGVTQGELAEARADFTALMQELEPAEEELAHLLNREKTMREQLSAARDRLLKAERAHMEAEAAVKLRGDEIEALREVMAGEGLRPEGHEVIDANAPAPEASAGRLPPIRGGAEVSVDSLRGRVSALRAQIRSLGPVNEQAATDYGESKERFDFLSSQVEDLQGSDRTLMQAIEELETSIRDRMQKTFEIVDKEFQRYFEAFFNGGKAHLNLTIPDDTANSGIEIIAQPPGKRVNQLSMLSGGERALTALALLLSLLEAQPSPICVLDEVDAALDETNVGRFVEALRALEKKTQFVIITHNPRTVEAADSIYGISMGSDNASRILSMKLDDVKQRDGATT